MNNIRILYLSFVTVILLLSSCVGSKKTVTHTPPITPIIVDKKLNARLLLSSHPLFNTLETRADAKYQDKTMNQSLELLIKQKGDSTYLSVSAGFLGLTTVVATGLADKDSIKAISKYENAYYQYSYEEIAKLINAPLDHLGLKNLLSAKPIFTNGKLIDEHQDGDYYHISMQQNDYIINLTYLSDNRTLVKQEILNEKMNFNGLITYDNYKQVNQYNMPYKQSIQLNMNGVKSSLDLNYTSYKLNEPVEFKFKIPNSYRLKN